MSELRVASQRARAMDRRRVAAKAAYEGARSWCTPACRSRSHDLQRILRKASESSDFAGVLLWSTTCTVPLCAIAATRRLHPPKRRRAASPLHRSDVRPGIETAGPQRGPLPAYGRRPTVACRRRDRVRRRTASCRVRALPEVRLRLRLRQATPSIASHRGGFARDAPRRFSGARAILDDALLLALGTYARTSGVVIDAMRRPVKQGSRCLRVAARAHRPIAAR